MTTPTYRPETFSRDALFAVHDLLGWAAEVAHEDLSQGDTEEARALAELHTEAGGQIVDLSDSDEGPDDPVRSVRAAIALLWMADADGPGEGWGAIAEDLERRLWARGPVVDVDADDVARDTTRRGVVAHRLSLAAKYGLGLEDAEFAEEAAALLSAIDSAHAGDCDGAA